jgi:two-component system copper resistance phosphate regulon response regulator CusR
MRLLVAEDDADVAGLLRRGLTEEAYAVDVVVDGEAAIEAAAVNPYDAVVLDVALPLANGLEVCRAIRESGSHVPILMLTARGAVDDRIAGLDAGADDYLAKPFAFGELLARLRALLRRGSVTLPSTVRAGILELDTRSHRVTVRGRPLTLTTKEYAVLEHLARNAGRIVAREELSEHVWGEDFDPFSNLIEVYINRLRRHLEKVTERRLIQTVRGSGYMLEGE